MQELIISLVREVSDLPPTMLVMAVSALGVLGVVLVARFIDKNAGGGY
jgi:hypothetical protein